MADGLRFRWERVVRGLPLRPPSRKLLALVLATYANGAGSGAHPGVDRLAEEVRLSPRHLRRHLAALRAMGLLERRRRQAERGRGRIADEYVLALPEDPHRRVEEHQQLEDRDRLRGDDQQDAQVSGENTPFNGTPRRPVERHDQKDTGGTTKRTPRCPPTRTETRTEVCGEGGRRVRGPNAREADESDSEQSSNRTTEPDGGNRRHAFADSSDDPGRCGRCGWVARHPIHRHEGAA